MQLDAIKTAIKNLQFFINKFNQYMGYINNQDEDHIESEEKAIRVQLKAIIRKIVNHCEQHPQASCYLPSGWTGETKGHAAALKIQKKISARGEMAFYFSILTLG